MANQPEPMMGLGDVSYQEAEISSYRRVLHDPMYRGAGTEKDVSTLHRHDNQESCSPPTEPEKTDWDADSSNEARRQSFLGLNVAFLVKFRLQDEVEIAEEGRYHNHGPDEDSKEREAFFSESEPVDVNKDDDEALKPDVK
jgi:hypothetical protein